MILVADNGVSTAMVKSFSWSADAIQWLALGEASHRASICNGCHVILGIGEVVVNDMNDDMDDDGKKRKRRGQDQAAMKGKRAFK